MGLKEREPESQRDQERPTDNAEVGRGLPLAILCLPFQARTGKHPSNERDNDPSTQSSSHVIPSRLHCHPVTVLKPRL